MNTLFTLHPTLEIDSIHLHDYPLSQLRLINNQHYLWLLLVPKLPDRTELYELTNSEQQQLLQEINYLSRVLKHQFHCHKLNIATLGNIVPQLHFHVIARNTDDPAWPKPVWGHAAAPYSEQQLATLLPKLKKHCEWLHNLAS